MVTVDGVFSLDGEDFDVDNNVWIVGDDDEVVVIDAAHDAAPIVEAVGGPHGAWRSSAPTATTTTSTRPSALADAVGAPIWLHPADRMLWDVVHPDRAPDGDLSDGMELDVADTSLVVRHTPGHSPGSCVLVDAGGGQVFTGDTLFEGGPGATGRSFSSRPRILQSIRDRLLDLPDATLVHTGHGASTTIGAERAGLAAAIAEELPAEDPEQPTS